MDQTQIDAALAQFEGLMQAVEDTAPTLSALGIPFAGLAGGVADVLGKFAEKARDVNEAAHTADPDRLQVLLAKASAFADEQERLALT